MDRQAADEGAIGGKAAALRLWRGEMPLPVTYWLCGVGGNMSFAALFAAAILTSRRSADRKPVPWLVYGGSLAWFVLIFAGIWRSAGRYRGRPIWATLARLGVASGILRMAGEAALLARLG